MLSRLAVILALGAGLAASPALAGCKISDIKIKNWEWRVEDDLVVVVGEAVNGCAEPTSVQFQMVMRDAAGKVVDDDDFWTDGDDVPSGETFAFKGLQHWIAKDKN